MEEGSRQLILLAILLLFSAFFSISETALLSINRFRLRSMIDGGAKGAKRVETMIEDPEKLLSSILIGNNVVNIAISAVATSFAIKAAGDNSIVIAITTGVVTIVILLFGEITPKTIATRMPEKIALLVINIIRFFVMLFSPIVFILSAVSALVMKIIGIKHETNSQTITENEFISMVDVSHEEGVIEAVERKMIKNVLGFADNSANDIMTPRTDMVSIPANSTYSKVFEIFKSEQFSRVPVYEDNTDNIIGVLHFKDLVFSDMDDDNFDMKKIMRQPYFSYESKPSSELFAEMRLNSFSLAVILDEYGGTSGIITLEDLVEEIVGDIFDEYDENEEDIQTMENNEYLVDGGTKIDDFNELAKTDLVSDEFDSLGGFVIELMKKIPEKGESAQYNNITFFIEETEKNRIEKIRIIINETD